LENAVRADADRRPFRIPPATHRHPRLGRPLGPQREFHHSTLVFLCRCHAAPVKRAKIKAARCWPRGLRSSRSNVSELGGQVAVDFEPNADFHKCGGCPRHLLFPYVPWAALIWAAPRLVTRPPTTNPPWRVPRVLHCGITTSGREGLTGRGEWRPRPGSSLENMLVVLGLHRMQADLDGARCSIGPMQTPQLCSSIANGS